MEKSVFLILCCLILHCVGCIGCSYEPEVTATLGLITEDEKLLETLKPRLPAISGSHPNDLSIQIGIVYLYRKYGVPDRTAKQYGSHEEMVQDQYDRVLRIDPNNRFIWSMKAKRAYYDYSSARKHLPEHLAQIIAIAKGRNVEKIKIVDYSTELKRWYEEENIEYIEKEIFDVAVEQMYRKFDKKAQEPLQIINEGQSKDPQNALYNYFRANIYLLQNEYESVVKEIEQAITKEYISTYQDEMAEAAAKVLKEAGLKQSKIDWITGIRASTLHPLGAEIWNEGLSKLADRYERHGDYDKAEKIYKMTILMAWQVEAEEVLPWVKGLDNVAFDRLVQLRAERFKKFVEESKRTYK